MSKVEIHVTPTGIGSTISVDGLKLPMVRAFSVQAHADGASRLVVDFIAMDVSITGKIKKLNMIVADLNPEHARLVAHTPTQDVVQFDDGHFEVVNNSIQSPIPESRCTSGHRSKPLIDSDEGWESMRAPSQ